MLRVTAPVIALTVTSTGCFPSFADLSGERASVAGGGVVVDAESTIEAPSPIDAVSPDGDPAIVDSGIAEACPTEACNGLVGNYYASQDFTGQNEIRIDPQIDFNWGYGPPLPGFVVDHFSVRWTGHLTPRFAEEYTFYVTSDDGAVLYIDGAKVIDHFTPHKAIEDMGQISLTAGTRHDIKLEYFDGGNEALITLAWSSASQPKEIVPSSQLSP
jgi:hypothetical protein